MSLRVLLRGARDMSPSYRISGFRAFRGFGVGAWRAEHDLGEHLRHVIWVVALGPFEWHVVEGYWDA